MASSPASRTSSLLSSSRFSSSVEKTKSVTHTLVAPNYTHGLAIIYQDRSCWGHRGADFFRSVWVWWPQSDRRKVWTSEHRLPELTVTLDSTSPPDTAAAQQYRRRLLAGHWMFGTSLLAVICTKKDVCVNMFFTPEISPETWQSRSPGWCVHHINSEEVFFFKWKNKVCTSSLNDSQNQLRHLFAIETKRYKEAGEDFEWDVIPHYISNNLRVPSVTRAANCFHRELTEKTVSSKVKKKPYLLACGKTHRFVIRMCLFHLECHLKLNLNSERNMVLFSHHSSFMVLTVDAQDSSYIVPLGLVLVDVWILYRGESCYQLVSLHMWGKRTQLCVQAHVR